MTPVTPASSDPEPSHGRRTMTWRPHTSKSFAASWALRSCYGRLRGSTRRGPRVFGVGAAKTGTHSLAQMYSDRVRAAHELDTEPLIFLHLDRVETGAHTRLRRFLARRDAFRDLALDVSHLYIYLLDDLQALFPDSRYIMTIRPPMDWLRSFIDDSLRREASRAFELFRRYRFATDQMHPAAEAALRDRGLFTLRGYLGYWCTAIRTVVDTVPDDRLLIVRTDELAARSSEIARFCGFDARPVSAARSKAFVNPHRSDVLSEISAEYLDAVVEETCGPLIARYFPPEPRVV